MIINLQKGGNRHGQTQSAGTKRKPSALYASKNLRLVAEVKMSQLSMRLQKCTRSQRSQKVLAMSVHASLHLLQKTIQLRPRLCTLQRNSHCVVKFNGASFGDTEAVKKIQLGRKKERKAEPITGSSDQRLCGIF